MLVKELAQILEKQFNGNAESRAAGMVINTMGWIEGVGYEVTIYCEVLLNNFKTPVLISNVQIMLPKGLDVLFLFCSSPCY